jgi:hypothetical protein
LTRRTLRAENLTVRDTILAIGLLAALGPVTSAGAAEFQIKEIRAYLFYSTTGALSENIVGSKKSFFNTVIGEGEAGGPASNVLIDLVLVNGGGPTQTATLKVAYKQQGRDSTLTRSWDNGTFNADEVKHESVMLENATCWPVTIEARVGKSSAKTATLKFACGE